MTHRRYEANFLLPLMAKDMRYAHAAAATLGLDLTTSKTAEVLFQKRKTRGYGDKDMSAVVEIVRRHED